MRRLINATILILAVVALASLSQNRLTQPESEVQATVNEETLLPVTTLRIGREAYTVEVAASPADQAQGLSDRPSMSRDQGMLFTFKESGRPSFWMKGMQFPLDFIWIRDGRVVEITPNVLPPAANTPSSELPTYSPNQMTDSVLELNAGEGKKFRLGDLVELVTTLTN